MPTTHVRFPGRGGPRDPYQIWISEIIMQQTRIEQGTPYYKKFISRFPSLESLASASHDEVISGIGRVSDTIQGQSISIALP